MSRCFHVQNQHTDTFLAPAVDMLVILAPPHPPKRQNAHQWIGSQFNRHNAGTVSAAPQRPKCQKHQRMDRHLFAVCRKRSHAVVQLPLPEFLNHIGSAQTEVFGRPAAAALRIDTSLKTQLPGHMSRLDPPDVIYSYSKTRI